MFSQMFAGFTLYLGNEGGGEGFKGQERFIVKIQKCWMFEIEIAVFHGMIIRQN